MVSTTHPPVLSTRIGWVHPGTSEKMRSNGLWVWPNTNVSSRAAGRCRARLVALRDPRPGADAAAARRGRPRGPCGPDRTAAAVTCARSSGPAFATANMRIRRSTVRRDRPRPRRPVLGHRRAQVPGQPVERFGALQHRVERADVGARPRPTDRAPTRRSRSTRSCPTPSPRCRGPVPARGSRSLLQRRHQPVQRLGEVPVVEDRRAWLLVGAHEPEVRVDHGDGDAGASVLPRSPPDDGGQHLRFDRGVGVEHRRRVPRLVERARRRPCA